MTTKILIEQSAIAYKCDEEIILENDIIKTEPLEHPAEIVYCAEVKTECKSFQNFSDAQEESVDTYAKIEVKQEVKSDYKNNDTDKILYPNHVNYNVDSGRDRPEDVGSEADKQSETLLSKRAVVVLTRIDLSEITKTKRGVQKQFNLKTEKECQSSDLRRYKLIHTGEKRHQCDVCKRRYTQLSHLQLHKLNHTGKKPHQCDVCKKCFIRPSHLRQHRLIHTGEKPHQCDECKKCFNKSGNLRKHRLIHTGEKRHQCEVCKRRFTQLSHLRLHRLKHTGKKPHQCDECKKCFTRPSHLRQHRLIHIGEKPYQCDVCKKCFIQSSYLRQHRLIHTGEKPHQCDTPKGKGKGTASDHRLRRKNQNKDEDLGNISMSTEVKMSDMTSNQIASNVALLNLTPTSSSSQRVETLGSGRSILSNMSLEIDVNIERDLNTGENSGSELENEDEDCATNRSVIVNRPGLEVLVPTAEEIIQIEILDAHEDQAIRRLAAEEVDVLNFDWSSDYNNFKGLRETFTGPSGPTFDNLNMTALEVFQQILDQPVIDLIVDETNKYARQLQSKTSGALASRLSRWKDTTGDEMWRFFSVLMIQSLVINNVEREYWYAKCKALQFGQISEILPYNRYLLIKRCLHFTDNTTLPEHPSKLHKILPFIERLNAKFSSLYLPEQNIAVDESLLLWKGRLSFSQKIATKIAREGIKSFELCESRTGYLWKMEVYSGKVHVHSPQEVDPRQGELTDEPENSTAQVVFNLMRPLFGRGHTLVMDNFYNSPLLSRLLKLKHHTDTVGPIRLNREFVPEALKAKNKKNMRSGEVCFSSTEDISLLTYMDKNVVSMVSTYHKPEVGGIMKYGYYKYKPKVILDYNLTMGSIDRKDQLLSSYPMERSRNLCWYKKLFCRLLNVAIHNASIMYSKKISSRSYRLELLTDILNKYSQKRSSPTRQPSLQTSIEQMHLPKKLDKSQRCKLCARSKVRCTTVWECATCHVNLCIDGCYMQYHKVLCETEN